VLGHELTHLFAIRLNPWAPPLLSEGLATWLQGTYGGYAIDDLAAAWLRQETVRLRPLLDPTGFFAASWGYTVAASFSGFLIRRSGWDTYRRFYRQELGAGRFDARFTEYFGLSLEEAEEQWRCKLLWKDIPPAEEEWWVCRFN
jgi:hypothetical protein